MDNGKRQDLSYIRTFRTIIVWLIFALIAFGGVRFYAFVSHFLYGTPQVERPPLVEGFLPIGAFMTLKLWLTEGIFDSVHPAGLVIFSAALLMSLLMKKSFCGWICPVGTLSELVYKIGGKITRGNITPNRYIDYALRSLKYILMAFFVYIVVFKMNAQAVQGFLDAPYWKVADVKMLRFFTDISTLTAVTIGVLAVASLFIRNFWCRYLCPYGALVGLLSALSPFKIRRDSSACINCKKCSASCPAYLPVHEKDSISSPECTGCLTCVSVCPARGALDIKVAGRKVNPIAYALMVLALFFGIIGVAKLTGHWRSNVTYEEYKTIVPKAADYEHP